MAGGGCCGSAEFALDVDGANGRDAVYVNMAKEREEWHVSGWKFGLGESRN